MLEEKIRMIIVSTALAGALVGSAAAFTGCGGGRAA